MQIRRTQTIIPLIAVAATLAWTATTASAATISEYFNGYGESFVALDNVGSAGDGWADGWVDDGGAETTAGTFPSYQPNSTAWPAFTFNNPDYNNAGNLLTNGHGQARGGANAGTIIERSLDTGLTGEIWVSAIVNFSSSDDVLLWLDHTSVGNGPFVALRNNNGNMVPRMRADGDQTSDNTSFAADTTWLFLAKAVVTDDGNDSLDFWIKGESDDLNNLGTAIYTVSGVDLFGSSFDKIGLSFDGNDARLDAIRISNDPDAFQQVLGVPEPASGLVIAAMGGAMMLRRQR